MEIQRIDNQRPTLKASVTVKVCGNVIEVRHSAHGPPEITIQKLNEDEYIDLRTGAIELFQHAASPSGGQGQRGPKASATSVTLSIAT